jgi:DNA-directed RNA polymerase specialized sigma24 family protein
MLHHDERSFAVTIATRYAQRLARRLGLAADHADDLRQELLVDLLERLARFDASRSPFTAFVRLVMRHHAATLAERWIRELRRPVLPLVDGAQHPDDEVDALQDEGEHDPAFAAAVTRVDLARTRAGLAPALRETCSALDGRDPGEAAALHPASRVTFYRRVAGLRLELLTWDLQPSA